MWQCSIVTIFRTISLINGKIIRNDLGVKNLTIITGKIMRFAAAILSTYIVALASAQDFVEPIISESYPDYFETSAYIPPTYNQIYSEKLPGPDFNKGVYEFDENQWIWDQQDYNERVAEEAE